MSRKYTTEEFIEKAKKIHGDKYDYSKVEYKNSMSKIPIICKKCGEMFFQTPNKHLQSRGCPKCSHNTSTTEEFIEKAKKIHGDKYDYSKVEYRNNNTKVCIICPKHGEFWQLPRTHISKTGCPKCGNGSLTTEEFIEKAKKIHGDKYDYSRTIYTGILNNVKVFCNTCKRYFYVNARNHLKYGTGCRCQKEHKTLTTEEFIEKAKKIHGDKYDYSKVEYKGIDSKICIICPKHGEFWQTAYNHLKGFGCIHCSTSKNENLIAEFLKEHGISFERQKRFKSCKNKKTLPFDFYLPVFNLCIEYQGRQHYEPVEDFGGKSSFDLLKNNDRIKKEWCKKEENPNLLEITYMQDTKLVLENYFNEKIYNNA